MRLLRDVGVALIAYRETFENTPQTVIDRYHTLTGLEPSLPSQFRAGPCIYGRSHVNGRHVLWLHHGLDLEFCSFLEVFFRVVEFNALEYLNLVQQAFHFARSWISEPELNPRVHLSVTLNLDPKPLQLACCDSARTST